MFVSSNFGLKSVNVGFGVEGHGRQASDPDFPVGGDLREVALGLFVVVTVGQVPGEAEDQGTVAGVTFPGESERAVQTGAQVGRRGAVFGPDDQRFVAARITARTRARTRTWTKFDW